MPLNLRKNNSDGSRIAIWQMTETIEELLAVTNVSEKLKSDVERLRSETRRKEWITVRILLSDILEVAHSTDLIYDEKGKPHLPAGKGHISFSHTKNFAAIIFHPEKTVGIDIESIHERIEKISHKFINENESAFIPAEKRTEFFHIIWGVKEVLFKIYGKGGVDFKKQLLVQSFKLKSDGAVGAEMRIDNSISKFNINYFFTEQFLLVYGCK